MTGSAGIAKFGLCVAWFYELLHWYTVSVLQSQLQHPCFLFFTWSTTDSWFSAYCTHFYRHALVGWGLFAADPPVLVALFSTKVLWLLSGIKLSLIPSLSATTTAVAYGSLLVSEMSFVCIWAATSSTTLSYSLILVNHLLFKIERTWSASLCSVTFTIPFSSHDLSILQDALKIAFHRSPVLLDWPSPSSLSRSILSITIRDQSTLSAPFLCTATLNDFYWMHVFYFYDYIFEENAPLYCWKF